MAHILVMLLILFSSLSAKDFGTYGHVFEVKEEDLLVWLKNRAKSLSADELRDMQASIINHYGKTFKEPAPLSLSTANVYRAFYLDPVICADRDIKNHEGAVVVRKGSFFNPLAQIKSLAALLFFDATDERQLTWARQQNNSGKWVLTKGKPLELELMEKKPIFFDQQGCLTKKFAIEHLPAKVSQDGLKLKVEEFSLKNKSWDSKKPCF